MRSCKAGLCFQKWTCRPVLLWFDVFKYGHLYRKAIPCSFFSCLLSLQIKCKGLGGHFEKASDPERSARAREARRATNPEQ